MAKLKSKTKPVSKPKSKVKKAPPKQKPPKPKVSKTEIPSLHGGLSVDWIAYQEVWSAIMDTQESPAALAQLRIRIDASIPTCSFLEPLFGALLKSRQTLRDFQNLPEDQGEARQWTHTYLKYLSAQSRLEGALAAFLVTAEYLAQKRWTKPSVVTKLPKGQAIDSSGIPKPTEALIERVRQSVSERRRLEIQRGE